MLFQFRSIFPLQYLMKRFLSSLVEYHQRSKLGLCNKHKQNN